MSLISRLAQLSYVFGLALVLSLLLWPSSSQGQYRGSPGIPGLTNFMAATGINIPNDGRTIGMLPPPMLLPLNNGMTGQSALGAMAGGGGMGMGGGMGGMGGVMIGMGGMGGGMMGMGGSR